MIQLLLTTIISMVFSKLKDLKITNKFNVDDVNDIVNFLKKDKNLTNKIESLISQALSHDLQIANKNSRLVNDLRGLVRPLCTLTAFFWYIYARVVNIELSVEDYSIIGGIMTFWFGSRALKK